MIRAYYVLARHLCGLCVTFVCLLKDSEGVVCSVVTVVVVTVVVIVAVEI